MGKMTILIGGDVAPTTPNMEQFRKPEMEALLGKALFQVWQEADIRVFNLESPLTDRLAPIPKCGPHLQAPMAAIEGIAQLNPSLVTLANNHILDHGTGGLNDTLQALAGKGILTIGAGNSLQTLENGIILTHNGLQVGFYACAEHEFSIAGAESPGASPYDPEISALKIAEMRRTADYLIVLYHGGKEYYRYPSPGLQERCRRLIRAGADLVVCQHSHCIGCEEKYEAGTILYGQGNFLYEKRDNAFWNTSLLVRVLIGEDGGTVDYLPIRRKAPGTSLAEGKEAEEILRSFSERSGEIRQEGFVEEQYGRYAREQRANLMKRFDWLGSTAVFRAIDRLTGKKLEPWYFDRLYRKKKYAMINTLECESWNELFDRAIRQGEERAPVRGK